MRTLASFIMTTLDGFYEGPDGEFDWPVTDDEFHDFSARQLDAADQLVFGRITYEGMASFWTTPRSKEAFPLIAGRMNAMPKLAVSSTLRNADWQPTAVARTVDELGELKRVSGRDILILGSPRLTASVMATGLLDELRILICPVCIGRGKSLFSSSALRCGLVLMHSRVFTSGNVLLTYHPISQSKESP